MTRLLRAVVTFALTLLAGLLLWQGLSWLGGAGQALAPVTGQYYVGDTWMTAPTLLPTFTPLPTTTPVPTATPQPTATPAVAAKPGSSTAQTLSTPDPFLLDAAHSHGIDPAGTYVIVNQNAQRMTVVEDGHVLRTLPVSTGDPDRGWYTPAWAGRIGAFWGTFTANGVTADNAWYLFKAGGSILIHSAPYTLAADGTKLYQGMNDLGVFPASRGCIRVAPDDAAWFTQWNPFDVPIVVLPWDSGTGREG